MNRSKNRQLSFLMAFGTAVFGLMATIPPSDGVDATALTQSPTVLRVVTRPSLHTYFEGRNGPDGMEFQLIQTFASRHGLQLELVLTDDSDAIYSALDEGLADVALLGQPLSMSRSGSYPGSAPYREVTYQLLSRSNNSSGNAPADFTGKTIVARDTEQNRDLYKRLKAYHGNMEWQFTDEPLDSLLTKVSRGIIDYTITDSLTFALKHPLYPNVDVALELGQPEPVSLLYSRKAATSLTRQLDHFIAEIQADGSLALLMEQYYGHATDFDTNGYRSFSFLMRNRLPEYQQSIQAVAAEFRMDWRLLAAIAYQESHWDPEARSKTGVRGFMMLTHDTATEMGVEDRVDTLQSLRGGARYFQQLLRDLPESIKEPDRTWMALAAYNVGAGHLSDAMGLTKQLGGDPHLWIDVKQHLPLLTQKHWHEQTRYGYARGHEPVDYVQNIRRYYDILAWRYPLQYHEKNWPENRIIVKTLDEVIQGMASPLAQRMTRDEPLLSSLLF